MCSYEGSLRKMIINPMGALEAPAAGGVEDEGAMTEWNELRGQRKTIHGQPYRNYWQEPRMEVCQRELAGSLWVCLDLQIRTRWDPRRRREGHISLQPCPLRAKPFHRAPALGTVPTVPALRQRRSTRWDTSGPAQLEERRANVMAVDGKDDAVDVEESEDGLISDLKNTAGPQEDESHMQDQPTFLCDKWVERHGPTGGHVRDVDCFRIYDLFDLLAYAWEAFSGAQGFLFRHAGLCHRFYLYNPSIGTGLCELCGHPSVGQRDLKDGQLLSTALPLAVIGGGTFAAYVNDDITKENVLMCLVLEQPEGLMAYAFGSDRPTQSRQVYPRVHGGVIKIVCSGMVPQWQDELVQRLHEPRRWNPAAALPDPVGRLHTVYQSADDHVVEEIFSDDERPLEVSAEEALNYEHGEVWISTPEDRIQHLSHLGRRVWGQVAGVEQMAPHSVVIFLDPRGVAHFPQWAQIEGECFCPVSYFNDLRIGSPDGWSLMVRGGDPIVDGENIRVHNGEVLELFLTRDPPEPEDPMDGESDSSDDDSEDPSDVGITFAILGILGEQLLGNEASEWMTLEPAALHAEQVTVAAALLWLVQFRAFIPVIDGHLFVDCLAAGRAVTGQWAPPNELAVRSHNLEG
eukprot:s3252_g5.t1